MKIATAIAALALVSAPSLVMAAPGSCERVKSDIEQRIINNGVPADNFTLTIVPNDQADQPDSQVDDRQVGNVTQSCEYDAYANPVDCRLVIVDESVKPAVSHHYTIKNRIDYY